MFRFKKLGYVALNVTDLGRSVPFYRDMVGLQLNEQVEGGPAFFSCSADHHNIVLHQGSEPGLKRVGFEMQDDTELAKAFEHVEKLGLNPRELSPQEAREARQQQTFRFREPNTGLELEFYGSMVEHGENYKPTVTKIARLGHVVVSVADWQPTVEFFTKELNFKVSDYVYGFIAFMRCWPNPYHHSLGIGNAKAFDPNCERNGLNHVNFMVTDLDDVGRGMVRVKKADIPIVFGPGRHPPSGSVFLYYLDPDGMTLEYSYGMEEFPERAPRKPRTLAGRPESLDYWGNMPDPRFAATGSIEQAA